MSVRARWLPAWPLLTAVVLYGWVTGVVWVGAILALLIVVACVVRQRWKVTRGGEVILLAAAIALGFVIGAYLPFQSAMGTARGILGPLATRLALACLLTAAARRLLEAPSGGESATVAIAFGAVIACGSIRPGPIYPWLLACFTLGAVASFAATRSSPVPWLSLPRARKGASLASLGSAVLLTVLLAWGLPRLHARMIRSLGGWQRPEVTGFSDRMDLGGEVDLTESDKVVLRIYGARVDYLRGATWQRYVRGEWRPWPDRGAETTVSNGIDPSSPRVEIRPETSTIHYFVPSDARQLRTGDGRIVADGAGILSAPRGEEAGEISFSPAARDAFAVAAPSPADAEVPDSIKAEIEKVARQWTGSETSTQGRLDAIERNLKTRYQWSLHHRRATRGDPVLDFLLRNPVGHCEYFATSMTLLARSLGIPARVVGGYRVTEHNALGGYDVVREWNAHAWVEAWTDGQGWQTWDPTPGSALAVAKPATTPWLGALFDVMLSGLLTRWLDTPSGPWIVRGVVALAALVVFRKRLLNLLRRSARPARAVDEEAPLALLGELLGLLAGRGYQRAVSEPLERFAGRLRTAPGMDPSAADAIDRYARLRYGDEGDANSVESGLHEACGRVQLSGDTRARRSS